MRFRRYFLRALLLRCPSCGQPTLVRRILAVHEQCCMCGLYFIHDEGSWLGAWHFNYFVVSVIALAPALVGVATGAWGTRIAVVYAATVSILGPVLLYWHAYSLWIATYYYAVPDDLRMGADRRPMQHTAAEEAALPPAERERLWAEEAVLDLEGDRRWRT